MFYLIIAVCLLLAIIFWCSFGYEFHYSDGSKGGGPFIAAVIFTALGLLLFAMLIFNNVVGYSAPSHMLPINGVCKVIFVQEEIDKDPKTENIHSTFITLIKLPDDQLRIFRLDDKLELGFIKVLPDYQLIPFLPIPAGNPFP